MQAALFQVKIQLKPQVCQAAGKIRLPATVVEEADSEDESSESEEEDSEYEEVTETESDEEEEWTHLEPKTLSERNKQIAKRFTLNMKSKKNPLLYVQ